ncbi:MAG: HPr family phosphocarrier protein [candidate division Zixibacteria bacterium]|nr:HPr family phosphocarrier protein [candidate division Zixibacteria bacterium]
MNERKVKVTNPLGVHARPAAMLVQTAAKFKSEIWLSKDGNEVNGKSMLGVMTLAAEMGSTVIIKADGPDEDKAIEALARVFEIRFGEA